MKKHLLHIILNAAFFFLNSFCFAQNKNIDSLQTLLKKDIADTSKVIHLCQLTSEFQSIGDCEKGLTYGTMALELAHKLNFKKGVAQAYINIGNIYWFQANYPNTIDYYSKALKLEEELKNKKLTAALLSRLAKVFVYQGDYINALDYNFKALKIYEELKNKIGISTCLGTIGIVYSYQSDYLKALDYDFKALKLDEELKDKNDIASDLGNIGIVYNRQGDYSKALEYYFKALKIKEEIGDKKLLANTLGNIGNVYSDLKDYPQALDYYFKALKMTEELGDKKGIAIWLGNIGPIYTKTGKFIQAEQYLKRATTLDDSTGTLDMLRQDYESLSQLYDTIRRYKDAMIYFKKATALKDTIFSQENKKQLVRKEMNYEFDKKEAITKAENDKLQVIAEEKNRKQKIITLSVACGLLLVLVFAGFIFRTLRITRKQKLIIENKNIETEEQKKIIEEKNKDITDSIRYAKRIQDALLREEEHVNMHLPEHFILFMPKDIVSGDFYWGMEKQGHWYFATVDCTGHGVPGAIMSMLGISFLNDIVSAEGLLSPAEILNRLRDKVMKELRQTGEDGGSKDGMDISLCQLDLKTNKLQWAGANNSLNLIQNGQLGIVKADKQPIGYHPNSVPFTNHEIQLQKGDSIYLYSDGYADQFGGSKGKKFKYKQLDDLIIKQKHFPMKEQKELLKKQFLEWKGSLEQVDDVCVFGIRV